MTQCLSILFGLNVVLVFDFQVNINTNLNISIVSIQVEIALLLTKKYHNPHITVLWRAYNAVTVLIIVIPSTNNAFFI